MITKSIGKNTLGGGKKMNVDLKTYNRSTHDLSYIWRSTMAPGTLVPFCKILAMPGDTFEFNLNHQVMTHPTIGPLFGSYKMQADMFQCPIRLYNALLHNNALNIGLDMKKVKLPKMKVALDLRKNNISTSSVLAYLGKRGYAGAVKRETGDKTQCVPLIAYYDIFKNYYANKQEENFYTISQGKELKGCLLGFVDQGTFSIGRLGTGNLYIPDTIDDIDTSYEAYHIIAESEEGFIIGYKLKDLVTEGWTGEKVQIINEEIKGNYWVVGLKSSTFSTNFFIKKVWDMRKPSLYSNTLEEIDETRESILSKGSIEWNLLSDGQPYIKRLADRSSGIFADEPDEYNTDGPYIQYQYKVDLESAETQSGLCVKTYQSDIFNNWINTDWIDGENGINSITAVKIDPESNSFQLDTLNLAKKVYDMLNRIAISGGTYQDWIETVYTNGYIERSETPIYEGGMSCEVEFNQVVSNSATTDEPLGSLAGRGVTNGQKGGHIIIKCDEPSYIIGIVSLTPRVDYCQGNDFDTVLDTLDDIHKPALDAIGFQDRMAETLDYRSVMYDEEGNKINGSIGKQPAWIDYMTNFNKTYGNFAIKDNEAFMCLNRWYESDPLTQTGDYTSYIDPQKYNYIFADTDLNAMNFWVQIGVSCRARRVMSAKVIPNL